ncbi:MAG: hypothetical protein ACE5KT_03820 [Methanosarcinales archaeon]
MKKDYNNAKFIHEYNDTSEERKKDREMIKEILEETREVLVALS